MQKTSGASRLNALLNKGSRLVSFDVLKQLPRLSDQRLNLLSLLLLMLEAVTTDLVSPSA
jgi:hypothetical protein